MGQTQTQYANVCRSCKEVQPDDATSCSKCKKIGKKGAIAWVVSLILIGLAEAFGSQDIAELFFLINIIAFYVAVYYSCCTITQGRVRGNYVEFYE